MKLLYFFSFSFCIITTSIYCNSHFDNTQKLDQTIKNSDFKKTIEICTNLIEKNNSHKMSYLVYRGTAYNKLSQYEKAFQDFNSAININPKRNYYIFYSRAKLQYQIDSSETEKICRDISRAINFKGSLISSKNLNLNHIDTTNIFDVNYLDMLKLRINNCREEMPLYIELDEELISKNKK